MVKQKTPKEIKLVPVFKLTKKHKLHIQDSKYEIANVTVCVLLATGETLYFEKNVKVEASI